MNKSIVIFAGTSDGRRLGEWCAARGIDTLLCVATEYGRELVEETACLSVRQGRMTGEEIEELLRSRESALAVDATHPYAVQVTRNVRAAAGKAGVPYLRMLRDAAPLPENALVADSMEEAARLLEGIPGTILLTVGSKNLELFTAVAGLGERLVARVLPTVEALEKCLSLGIPGERIIAMHGPFSHQINVAQICQKGVSCLVTKESGDAGGFREKVSAAGETGIRLLVVRRPGDAGLSQDRIQEEIASRFPLDGDKTPPVGKPHSRFPLFLSLEGKPVAVVGGGKVAARRIPLLLEYGAKITLISPQVTPLLEQLHQNGAIRWLERGYRHGDIQGAFLALAATGDPVVNRQVAREADERNVLCSVADNRELSGAWFPALIQGDDLLAGLVSPSGDHSRVAKAAQKLRRNLEQWN